MQGEYERWFSVSYKIRMNEPTPVKAAVCEESDVSPTISAGILVCSAG